MSIECVRCLTQYEQELNTEFDELFAFASKGTTEAELILSDTGNIDLAPLVWEYLALELPIKPLCKPDCRGLCIICGEDLNIGECEHSRQQPTPD